MEEEYNRLAILILDGRGNVLYKTNQLETNNRCMGELVQPNKGIAAVSFQDLDRDGLTDIILITNCENSRGEYAGKPYKTGDVLFQRDGGFYRDWRVSDKINRFSMNKSIDCIASYVRDGNSTEALYTASTLEELLESGFQIIEEQCYYRRFEKQGLLRVVPGVIRMGEYNVFMIYLVNEQGYIVWSFQPMGDYDNLYALKGMACRDLDGDGMKDLVVLGRYSYSGPEGKAVVDTRCSIYYQRTEGFAEDKEFESIHQCTEEDTVSGLVELIREYWGWPQEDDKDIDRG
ncbi:MAG: VCBS repeat-containing protein [Acetatifactor sp.]|nr:VCBS repeat-containing protein [Acetatifactor sp.]MDE7351788.1 VCBS repeat-containing protein [Acetatifactor sp.]